jgi:SAM-dependent methyltransferase
VGGLDHVIIDAHDLRELASPGIRHRLRLGGRFARSEWTGKTVAVANEQMRRYWNDVAGQEWVALAAEFDRTLGPAGDELLRRAAARPGEHVLDVGCGFGTTTLALARAVGAAGRVMGVDISAPMLGLARWRAADAAVGNVIWREGDAQDMALPGRHFDLIVSRFGVMFFDDPASAFSNLCRSAGPGARLHFACWQSTARNPWYSLAARTLAHYIEVPPPQPDAPGPFAFGDTGWVAKLLTAAGFVDVAADEFNMTLIQGGSRGIDGAIEQLVRGPLAAAVAAAPDRARQTGLDALRAELALHVEDGEVRFPASAWMVAARTPV